MSSGDEQYFLYLCSKIKHVELNFYRLILHKDGNKLLIRFLICTSYGKYENEEPNFIPTVLSLFTQQVTSAQKWIFEHILCNYVVLFNMRESGKFCGLNVYFLLTSTLCYYGGYEIFRTQIKNPQTSKPVTSTRD